MWTNTANGYTRWGEAWGSHKSIYILLYGSQSLRVLRTRDIRYFKDWNMLEIDKNKFYEELIAYFPLIRHGRIENDASKYFSMVACVFVGAGKSLPSRCLAAIGGHLYRYVESKVISWTYFHFFQNWRNSPKGHLYDVSITASIVLLCDFPYPWKVALPKSAEWTGRCGPS
jgi:hypothetical protein